jgi:hypothetical protein
LVAGLGRCVGISPAIEELRFFTVADVAIGVRDADERAAGLQSRRRAAGVDTMIEVKPDVGVEAQ